MKIIKEKMLKNKKNNRNKLKQDLEKNLINQPIRNQIIISTII